jgi:hypothetical protein
METVKLKLAEARELQKELFGFKNESGDQTFKGMLNQDLKAATKFKLVQLGKKIQEHDTAAEEQRKALIEKYGTIETNKDGSTFTRVDQFILDDEGNSTGQLTESFIKFVEEYNELLNTEVALEVTKLSIADLDFKSEEVYPFVFEYLVQE